MARRARWFTVYAVGWLLLAAAASGAGSQQVRTEVSGAVFDSVSRKRLSDALAQLVRLEDPARGRSLRRHFGVLRTGDFC